METTWRILGLFAEGLAMAEVAARTGLDPAAVRAHLTAAMAELGARSKLEAIIIAWRRGLIGAAKTERVDKPSTPSRTLS